MPLTVSISVTQNTGTPSEFTIQDTSTGSDPGITSRRVYIFTPSNTNLVNPGVTTSYTEWDISDSEITMDVLERDMALLIRVQWLTGSSVTYTYENTYCFTAYTKTFLYNLTETQSTNPAIVQATDYFENKATMWECIDDAENATLYEDIQTAQLCLDICYYFITNSAKFF